MQIQIDLYNIENHEIVKVKVRACFVPHLRLPSLIFAKKCLQKELRPHEF